MKRFRTVSPKAAATNPRGGTTLTEVLMSILVMGIGVVAVASLFPIALLRSVQATQLTSGTILRLHAETLIDIDRKIALNPDFVNDLDEYAQPPSPFVKPYLVDPLGSAIAAVDNDGRTANRIGNLRRWNLDLTTEQAAEKFVTLPDSWVQLYDIFPEANDSSSVTLPSNVPQDVLDTFDSYDTDNNGTLDVAGNEVAGDVLRVVLFNEEGRLSEVRYIRERAQIETGATIDWNNQAALPDNNQYFDNKISRVWIEVRERRYTWLLTVRDYTITERDAANNNLPLGATGTVDVVIFFRRSPSLEDETLYELSDVGANTRTYLVNKLNANDAEPFLKRGGFMLDTKTGRWHRLAKVNGNTITLEKGVTSSLNTNRVVFMRGVVDFYTLVPKSIP